MNNELSSLENRLTELIDAYQSLRMENRELTSKVLQLQADNERSAEKLDRAKKQIESILARLPTEEV